jgi:hypothetical protein
MVVKFLAAVFLFAASISANGMDAEIDLEWTPPTENVDGTVLTDLAGFNIYWKFSATGIFSQSESVANENATTYTLALSGLQDQAEVYVAMTAYDHEGNESTFSNIVTFFFNSVDALSPQTPAGLTGTAKITGCPTNRACAVQ